MSSAILPADPVKGRNEFFSQLHTLVGDEGLLTTDQEVRPFETDGLAAYRKKPLAVVLPSSIDQVCRVMALCRRNAVPVVARGAGTGLSGGALPHEQGVLLVLTRFDRILELDPQSRTARVQPGVRNLAISEAAAPHGLYYAPDPSSQLACSIGGNVSENSGGIHCLKYGLTVQNVLEVRLVTIDGELVVIGGQSLDSPGFDLLAAVHGSEGMLGVIVEILVRLLPVPENARVVLGAFSSVKRAGDAVGAVIASGIIPAGMEMMDRLTVASVEKHLALGYPGNAEAVLLCEVDGTHAEVESDFARVQQIFSDNGAFEVRGSRSEEERQRIWLGRKAAFPALGHLKPDYFCMDGTIPRSKIGEVLVQINELAEEYGLIVANVFHAGDGNLHPLILYDAAAGEMPAAEKLGAAILGLCLRAGGTITGEHGVGHEKINQMCDQFNGHEIEQFHRFKRAFDPEELLNPGKAVPTLNRCAEFGGMHVHGNEDKFPDLPRF